MQTNLKNRVEALERQAPSPDSIDTIIVSFVESSAAGPVRCEPVAMGSHASNWRLEREPSEDLEAFRDRAKATCPRNAGGMAMLLELPE
ncbi:MAG: hypothetical protein K0Q43_1869 [Ramlibacter sp.]|jgi:hypothetical protein|nr:hypothetical protein [Ramlibacter sp.]